jgi:Mn2+/Fe2+ NRAMP family transporter
MEYRTTVSRVPAFFHRLGPGLLLAATSIGASHLVMSPKAGSMFGFRLLWLVTLTHFFKYHAFESGPRYAAATGESLIAGYMRLPGPRGWALWVFLAGTVAQGIGVLSGVVSIAAAVLYSFIGGLSFAHYSALVIITVLLFLRFGGYGWLDLLNKIMMIVLFVATVIVFVPVFPSPRVFLNYIVVQMPLGSIALVAAILGWMPTGIDVSIWHSLWILEKFPWLATARRAVLSGETTDGNNRVNGSAYFEKRSGSSAQSSAADDFETRKRIWRFSLVDMRIGYVLSFVVASVFLLLGAIFLHGTSYGIEDSGFARSLAVIYTERLGGWMFVVFMIAAFFAMYSTSYTVMDGFPRSFAEAVTTLFPGVRRKWWAGLYWGFIVFSALFAFIMILTVGNPVTLVMIVAILSLAVAPLYCALNYYCITRFVKEEVFRPNRVHRAIALSGIAFMSLVTLVYIASKLGVFG